MRLFTARVENGELVADRDQLTLDLPSPVRWVVANPIAPDQVAWLQQHTKGDLANLYRGGLTRGGGAGPDTQPGA